MYSGVIKGTLLCCEENNSTWNNVIIKDEDLQNGSLTLMRFLYKIVIPMIICGGIIGNILILVILTGPMFRGVAYLYLSGLALAHIGVLVFWIPISISLIHGMRNDYPSAFYHAHLELVAVNTFAIASTLIMISFIMDRYIFVFFPARIRSGNTRKNVRSFILCSFILGFSASAPLTGMRRVHQEQSETEIIFSLRENTSVTGTKLWAVYIWAMDIGMRTIPTIIFILLNSLVVKKFMQLNAKKKEFQSVSVKFRTANNVDISLLSRNRGYREEQHLVRLTTVMVLCFIVAMIPSILLSELYQNSKSSDAGYQLFRIFTAVVEVSNFFVYIFIYILCSKEFRRELMKVFQGKCREEIQREPEPPVGEIEDFSRNGTTFRLTPEITKLNSPASAPKLNTMDEDGESESVNVEDSL